MSLVFSNISKTYSNNKTATLKDINLKIGKGEFVCIVGKSGCGKSTLLNLAAGLEQPSSGRISLDDREVTKPGADRTVMFQEHGLFPWLTVQENVEFGMKLAKIPLAQRREKAEYYLNMVHLQQYKDYYIHEISGGMRQRTALARALVMDSDILLMDEPFSALDKQTSNSLREELQRIWMETKKTILFVTHSVEEAVYLSERVVVLSADQGNITDIIPVDLPVPAMYMTRSLLNCVMHYWMQCNSQRCKKGCEANGNVSFYCFTDCIVAGGVLVWCGSFCCL